MATCDRFELFPFPIFQLKNLKSIYYARTKVRHGYFQKKNSIQLNWQVMTLLDFSLIEAIISCFPFCFETSNADIRAYPQQKQQQQQKHNWYHISLKTVETIWWKFNHPPLAGVWCHMLWRSSLSLIVSSSSYASVPQPSHCLTGFDLTLY